MKVLSNKDFSDIITWMPSGRSFSVIKPKAFTAAILPDHFKSAKYSSFTRKLHRWGFTRHYKGDEAGAFYHKDFQKDRLDLTEKMTCHKVQDSATSSEMEQPSTVRNASAESKMDDKNARAGVSLSSIALPSIVRRASNATTIRTTSLLAHAFPQPLLSVPVPKQQRSGHFYEPHQSLPSLYNMADMSNSQDSLVAAKINAAIEMEVSRRLQERIKVAAAHMTHVPRGHAALNNFLPLTSPKATVQRTLPVADVVSATTASLRAKLAQMQQQKERMQYLAMTGMIPVPSQGLGEMPKTNIQGAKTA